MGIFDSGVGGLTVLEAVRRRLPDESTFYLGDTARLPYGPKSPDTVVRYAREAAVFLARREVKLIVVACNTASARALPALQSELEIPVLGVVEPGARAAAAATRSGRVGVIGTRGTIESRAYETAILGVRPDISVRSAACPLFVSLVEEGWTEGKVARLVAERYLEPLLRDGIDVLVLGCTHYPHLKGLLADISGPAVRLVEPAEATAEAVASELVRLDMCAPPGSTPIRRHYVTDDARRFRRLARRWTGAGVEHLELVTLPEG